MYSSQWRDTRGPFSSLDFLGTIKLVITNELMHHTIHPIGTVVALIEGPMTETNFVVILGCYIWS